MAFFVYEEYAAKYQEVIKAPKRPSRAADKVHGKGTETLISASNSWDNRMDYGKRAMELYDMLFKVSMTQCLYSVMTDLSSLSRGFANIRYFSAILRNTHQLLIALILIDYWRKFDTVLMSKSTR